MNEIVTVRLEWGGFFALKNQALNEKECHFTMLAQQAARGTTRPTIWEIYREHNGEDDGFKE